MLEKFVVIFFVIGLVFALFIAPVYFMRGVLTLEYGELSKRDKLLSLVPVLNVGIAETTYTGKKVSFIVLFTVMSVLTFISRFLLVGFMVTSVFVHYISIIGFFLSVILMYLANVVLVYKIINDAGTKSIVASVLNALLFPLGQYYIGTTLNSEVKWLMKQEDTF